MYRFLIATICLAITFTAVGCGSKKSGSKASMRARSGTFDGKARNGKDTNDKGENTDKAQGEAGVQGQETTGSNRQNSELCKNTVESIAPVEGEETLEGELKSLKDSASNDELVLESVHHFFEHKSKDASGQIEIKAIPPFVGTDVAAADAHTDIVCANNIKFVEFSLPNKIKLADGSYDTARVFKAEDPKPEGDNKINSFISEAGNVESDEYRDKAAGGAKTASHIFSKDKNGNVYWRMKAELKDPSDSSVTRTFVLLAKYKQQPIAATSESAKP